MTDIERQTREFAKRWCKANGRNSRHVRIEFAADFAATRETEIAELRARVAELEGMVPRWVDLFAPDYDCIARAGWVSIPPSGKTGRLRLMVPPIPLPEGEND